VKKLSWCLFSLLPLLAGCPSQERLGFDTMSILGEGVINDPENKSLRFDLLKFGLDQFCSEMKRRGAPLKLRDGDPVVGRFFAETCDSQIVDNPPYQSFIIRYSGRGYGWTNVSKRLGFATSGMIEYAPDFQLHNDAMYVYFRPRNINAASFSTTLVESSLLQTGMALAQINADELGRNMVLGQLQRGFTVIRYSRRGETDFAAGLIAPGARPFRPFNVVRSEKLTLDNDRTDVHSGQQDFVGGFTVTDDDQALYLTLTIDGAPGVDVLLVPEGMGDQLLMSYTTRPGPTGLLGAPIVDEAVPRGSVFQRAVAVPPGTYYLLLDHSAGLGRTAPPQALFDDRAATVDYLVQLGDAP
jgi:hypothetical protein